jgi:hypothetical protein
MEGKERKGKVEDSHSASPKPNIQDIGSLTLRILHNNLESASLQLLG